MPHIPYQKALTLWLLFLSCIAISACDKTPTITPLSPDTVILAFGDSLTYGTGASAGQSYPDVLAELLNTTVINAGSPGEVSATGRNRLPFFLKQHNPTLVILCHGGNDFLRRGDKNEVANNLRTMVELSRAAGADVLLVGVPDFSLTLSTHSLYAQLSDELNIPFEGEIIEQVLTDSSLKSDHIHPNVQGYQLMAEALARLIQQSQADH